MKHIQIIETEVNNCGDCPNAKQYYEKNDDGTVKYSDHEKTFYCSALDKDNKIIQIKREETGLSASDFIYILAASLSRIFEIGLIEKPVLDNCPLKEN